MRNELVISYRFNSFPGNELSQEDFDQIFRENSASQSYWESHVSMWTMYKNDSENIYWWRLYRDYVME